MRGIVTGQRAGVRSLVVGDRDSCIRSHDVRIEADQSLACRIGAAIPSSVPGVAGRATEPRLDVLGMLRKTRILQHIGKVVALRAHRIRTIRAEIRIRKQVGDRLPGRHRLAQFITPLQNVSPLRSVRPRRSRASEFAIVVAVVTIRAIDLGAHRPTLGDAVQVQHVRKQTRLWQRTCPRMKHRVAGTGSCPELWNDILTLRRRSHPHRLISIFGGSGKTLRIGAVAAQASLELVLRRPNDRHAIGFTDAPHFLLRRSHERRGDEGASA